MSGESLAWRDTADSIFASFGDVVRVAVVSTYAGTTNYDTVTGQMVKTRTDVDTVLVPLNYNFKLFGREKYQDLDKTLLVRGSDFSAIIDPGAIVTVYKEDGTTLENTYVVIQSESEDAGTGALQNLHVRKAAQTLTFV